MTKKGPKTYFNWSTGKDASLALYHLQQQGNLDIDLLLTSVNAHHNRISMHGLKRELLEAQCTAIGLPLKTIELPEQPTMEDYNEIMEKTVGELKSDGYTDCAFGDIFLEDLRAYREEQLKGINCHFPLWKRDTTELMHEFIELGFKAVVVCVNGELLDDSYLGRELNHEFLKDLPNNVDPCGENGEFHTFCYDGPIFSKPVSFEFGEKTLQRYKKPNGEPEEHTGFWFLNLNKK